MQALSSSRLLTWLGAAALAAAAVIALAWLFQRRLIYIPLDSHVPPAARVLPGAEEISFPTADGLELGGWFVPSTGGPARATVLVCNGNAGNRAYRAELAGALAAAGIQVMLFDYRGYGGNAGRPTESGLLEDVRAARSYLESRPEVDAGRLFLLGESLGAAVALAEAVERPPRGLILRSPFKSMTDVGKLHYPFLPVGLLLRDRYPSDRRILGLACPLLVVVGERDRIVPAASSRALWEAAPRKDKKFVTIPGADHNDPDLLAGERWISEVLRFVGQEER
jgi:fermentation-respiration switch protein FrsA (DUF1100 family)